MFAFERWVEPFKGLTCSDCDPTFWDDEERSAREEEGEELYEKPFVFAIPAEEAVPKYCPRCGSYLSLSVDEHEIMLSGHIIDRSARYKLIRKIQT